MDQSKNVHPGKILELSGAYWQTCTLHAGVKLDIFSHLGRQKITAQALADKLNLDARGLSMLLNALCAMALLKKEEDGYANTSASLTLLSKESPEYIGYMIMHHHHLVESWASLDRSVMTGAPARDHAMRDDPEYRENFLMGMFNNAMAAAPELVRAIDLEGKKTLLDLGGGPGTYAIHFCMHNPDLKAWVFDLPTTRPFAEKTIKRFNQQESVSFTGGNFLKDDLDGTYDVVWLSHILHGESPEDCEKLVKKAVSALNPGGVIIIHDFILDNLKISPLFPALFSLNMLLGTRGQAYSEMEIMSMIEKAGIDNIKRIPFKGPNDSGLVVGTL
ncbi:MAG: methyltransferase [Thermodesulfobacteriota bacterium]|nr:methyltransferase [Thermodesulfobacteriota bacterium]